MHNLHALTRILNLVMIAAVATLFMSLWFVLITGEVVTSGRQIVMLLAFLTPITLFLIAPYAVLFRAKRAPLSTMTQEWITLCGSLLTMGLTATIYTRPIYVPDLPALGALAIYVSPFSLGAVQLILAVATVVVIRRIQPALAETIE